MKAGRYMAVRRGLVAGGRTSVMNRVGMGTSVDVKRAMACGLLPGKALVVGNHVFALILTDEGHYILAITPAQKAERRQQETSRTSRTYAHPFSSISSDTSDMEEHSERRYSLALSGKMSKGVHWQDIRRKYSRVGRNDRYKDIDRETRQPFWAF